MNGKIAWEIFVLSFVLLFLLCPRFGAKAGRRLFGGDRDSGPLLDYEDGAT